MKFFNFIFNIVDKITLSSKLVVFSNKVLIQSGFYLDFFLKKNLEVFIRNLLIYTAQFFGEKYIIEVLIKKPLELYNYKLYIMLTNSNFNLLNLFKQLLIIFMVLIS